MLHKGSEWHKWDLHIHTPASVLRSEFGDNENDDIWDNYVKELFTRAIANNIAVIGITDYFTIDGYKKLRNDYLENPDKLSSLFTTEQIEKINKILVIPNIEFRLDAIISTNKELDNLSRKLNYHVLLSNELSIEDIELNFLNQLSFCFNGNIGEKIENKPLNKINLTELGKRLKQEHANFSNQKDIFIGMINAGVDSSKIAKILESSTFKNKYLMGINPDEDLSKASWDSQGHNCRKTLIKQAHFVFTANSGTIDFMAGRKHETIERFVQEFGSLKPCLWGSDAHSIEELFIPDKNRFTWLKTTISFDGLKQTIYDPESRVCIQDINPQQKSAYQIIDSIRFIDKRDTIEFSGDSIPINPYLTTIIGGKSSGKSLLLYHIAKATNKSETESQVNISKSATYNELNNELNFDFEVKWSNGDISLLSNNTDEKPITYIPQLYINHLAEKDGLDQLNSDIEKILCQNDNFKKYLSNKRAEIFKSNQAISENIGIYFNLKSKMLEINKEIISIGVKDSIKQEIEVIKKRLDELRITSGLNETESLQIQKLTTRLDSLRKRHDSFNSLKIKSDSVLTFSSEQTDEKISHLISEMYRSVSTENTLSESNKTDFINSMFNKSGIKQKFYEIFGSLKDIATTKSEHIQNLINKIESEIKLKQAELEPLNLKIEEQSLFKQLEEKLKIEEDKIKRIEFSEKQFKETEQQKNEHEERIVKEYKKLIQCYIDITIEVEKPECQIEDDMSIKAQVIFKDEKFNQFLDCFDRRGNMKNLLGELSNDEGKFIFQITKHTEELCKVFKK